MFSYVLYTYQGCINTYIWVEGVLRKNKSLIPLKSSSKASKKRHMSRMCSANTKSMRMHLKHVLCMCLYKLLSIHVNAQLYSARLRTLHSAYLHYGSCMCNDTPVKGSLSFTEINGMKWSILSMRTPAVKNMPSFARCLVVSLNCLGQIVYIVH